MTVANAMMQEEFYDALKINTSIDKKRFSTKPSKTTAKDISNRIAGYPVYDSLEKFPTIMGEQGYSWCPATFTDGKRRIASF